MKILYALILFTVLLFSNQLPNNALYLQGTEKTGIILAHGKGMHPDFKVVKPLRIGLNEDMGFHTLSLQMPNKYKDYKDYEREQNRVNLMINQAIDYLHIKGVNTIYLVGHSLGAGMTSCFLIENPNAEINGYIAVGCRGNASQRISCNDNIKKITIPVLDIWGDSNIEDKKYATTRSHLQGKNYTQLPFVNANHVLDGVEGFLVEEVENWIETQKN